MRKNKIILAIFIGFLAVFIGYFLLRGDTVKQNTSATKVVEESGMQTNAANATNVKNAQGYYDIGNATLIQMFKNKDFVLVNVHIPYAGELANTDAFIPYDTIERNLGKLPSDKNAKIVLYCRSGSMSATAAQKLSALGYTNVYNLAGGMNEWEERGNTIIKE